ncbi:MAG: M23 family metallopeptidase [Bacteroidia bacterium]|nr:M23 family metallopeptidase [Bacteroidia bacterium]
MKTNYLLLLPFFLLAAFFTQGCKKENLPDGLEWSVLNNPSRFPLMNDKVALVYEVMVKNTSIDSYAFELITVKDGSLTIQNLFGNELDTIVAVYHSNRKSLMAGETALLFMWVEPSPTQSFPESLTQTIQFNRVADGKQYTKEIEVSVNQSSPVVLSAPLKARRYATAGAPSYNSYHRRTVNFLDEKFWISERYAMDFIGLDDGNRYRQGRQDANIDYYGYEDIVYSTTAGEIVSIIDTLPDNIPPKVPEINSDELYRTGGNQVVVKLSDDAYIFYGHLVRSSIDLKVGDKVEVGQPIGRLGNSGNSDAPQLHLQVMDGPDPLRSNGISWVFDRFVLHGNITGYDHTNGMIRVNYLTIQKETTGKNFGGDAVVGFE